MSGTYGVPPSQFGSVIAGVYINSRSQALVMREMLEREMKVRAGTPQESVLAHWYRELVHSIRESEREGWRGWQDEEKA